MLRCLGEPSHKGAIEIILDVAVKLKPVVIIWAYFTHGMHRTLFMNVASA